MIIRRLIPLLVAAATLAFAGSALAAARLKAPGSARPGHRIAVTGTDLKPGAYRLSVAASDTSGAVCIGQFGPRIRVHHHGHAAFRTTVPRRIPCYRGARGTGPQIGSRRLRSGRYFLFLGQPNGHATWARKASFLHRIITIR